MDELSDTQLDDDQKLIEKEFKSLFKDNRTVDQWLDDYYADMGETKRKKEDLFPEKHHSKPPSFKPRNDREPVQKWIHKNK